MGREDIKTRSAGDIPGWALMLQSHLDDRLGEMRKDISDMRGDIGACREDVAVVRSELSTVRTEVVATKLQVNELQSRLHDGDLRFHAYDARLSAIEAKNKSPTALVPVDQSKIKTETVTKPKAMPWYMLIAITAGITVVGTNVVQRFWDVMFPRPDSPASYRIKE